MTTLRLGLVACGLALLACATVRRSLGLGTEGNIAACAVPLVASGCPAAWINEYEAAPAAWTIVHGTVSVDGHPPEERAETSTSLVEFRPDGRRSYTAEPYQTGYVGADGRYCVMVPRELGPFHVSVHAFDIRSSAEWDPPVGGTHCHDVRFD